MILKGTPNVRLKAADVQSVTLCISPKVLIDGGCPEMRLLLKRPTPDWGYFTNCNSFLSRLSDGVPAKWLKGLFYHPEFYEPGVSLFDAQIENCWWTPTEPGVFSTWQEGAGLHIEMTADTRQPCTYQGEAFW